MDFKSQNAKTIDCKQNEICFLELFEIFFPCQPKLWNPDSNSKYLCKQQDSKKLSPRPLESAP